MSPKMGRPKSENPKGTQVSARLDDATLAKLDRCSIYYGETRADTIRRGIELVIAQKDAKK